MECFRFHCDVDSRPDVDISIPMLDLYAVNSWRYIPPVMDDPEKSTTTTMAQR